MSVDRKLGPISSVNISPPKTTATISLLKAQATWQFSATQRIFHFPTNKHYHIVFTTPKPPVPIGLITPHPSPGSENSGWQVYVHVHVLLSVGKNLDCLNRAGRNVAVKASVKG